MKKNNIEYHMITLLEDLYTSIERITKPEHFDEIKSKLDSAIKNYSDAYNALENENKMKTRALKILESRLNISIMSERKLDGKSWVRVKNVESEITDKEKEALLVTPELKLNEE